MEGGSCGREYYRGCGLIWDNYGCAWYYTKGHFLSPMMSYYLTTLCSWFTRFHFMQFSIYMVCLEMVQILALHGFWSKFKITVHLHFTRFFSGNKNRVNGELSAVVNTVPVTDTQNTLMNDFYLNSLKWYMLLMLHWANNVISIVWKKNYLSKTFEMFIPWSCIQFSTYNYLL